MFPCVGYILNDMILHGEISAYSHWIILNGQRDLEPYQIHMALTKWTVSLTRQYLIESDTPKVGVWSGGTFE